MSKTIEEQEVGTPKDYAQQIMLALRNLEHGMSMFQGQWFMEAGEEDNIFELIEHAISKYGKERDHLAYERGRAKALLDATAVLHRFAMQTKDTNTLDLIESMQKEILQDLTPLKDLTK